MIRQLSAWCSRLILLLAILMLAACQTVPLVESQSDNPIWLDESDEFDARYLHFAQLNNWKIRGKVAVKTPQLNESGNINWHADAGEDGWLDHQTVSLYGPLGAGAVKLVLQRQMAEITDSKGRVYREPNAEYLLEKITRWPIPVDSLPYWLFAMPEPGVTFRYQKDLENRLMTLQQSGWTIAYRRFELISDQWMPTRITATQQQGNETVVVKLAIKEWQY